VELRPVVIAETGLGESVVPELHRRLAAIIPVPALRQRREDIPALVRLMLADLCAAADIPPKVTSNQATELLTALPWRRNISELESSLKSIVEKVPGRTIRLADVLAIVRLDGAPATTYSGTLREARERFEREYVTAVLEQHRGRMAEAAKALGLQRTNLYRKVRQLALKRRSPRRHVSFR
jgi:two-component system nitrogen regulation response regulator NtrX